LLTVPLRSIPVEQASILTRSPVSKPLTDIHRMFADFQSQL
jgi:hypothetical protein